MADRKASSGHTGVRVRRRHVEVRVPWQGDWVYERVDVPATAAGLARAARIRQDVLDRHRLGVLTWADHFPTSSRAEAPPAEAPIPLYEEIARQYLGHCASSMSVTTLKGYRKRIEGFWIPSLGHMPVTVIRRSHILEVTRAYGWTGKTLTNALTPLRGSLDVAIDDDLIAKNPAERIRAPGTQRPRPTPLTAEEVPRALAACAEHQPEWLPYWQLAVGTGMRPSEQIGLRWASVDRAARSIRVHEVRVENTDRASTKMKRERIVPLSALALRGIQAQRAVTELHSPYVFLHPSTGEPIRDDQAPRRSWNRMLADAELPARKAYSARHTFACLHLAAGTPLTRVSEWMGHQSPRMTLEHYAAWIPTADSGRDIDRVDAFG